MDVDAFVLIVKVDDPWPVTELGLKVAVAFRRQPTDAERHRSVKAVDRRHVHRVRGAVASRDGLGRRRRGNGERIHNQSDRRRVREASAGPRNGERVASRRRAAAGRHTHAARTRATDDRIRAERGSGPRG